MPFRRGSRLDPILLTIARAFAARVKVNFDTPVRAQPEDQLKAPVVELIEGSGTLFARNVEARTEAQVQGLGARPDIGVAVDRLLSGFIELKAPGKGARPERFTSADREQWQKFQRLPNLIYTDGSEWSLFRTGTLTQRFNFAGRVVEDGATAVTAKDAEDGHRLEQLEVGQRLEEVVVPDREEVPFRDHRCLTADRPRKRGNVNITRG